MLVTIYIDVDEATSIMMTGVGDECLELEQYSYFVYKEQRLLRRFQSGPESLDIQMLNKNSIWSKFLVCEFLVQSSHISFYLLSCQAVKLT